MALDQKGRDSTERQIPDLRMKVRGKQSSWGSERIVYVVTKVGSALFC